MKIKKGWIKIGSLVLLCCMTILSIALIPINIFCTNFPEWVPILVTVLFCCGLIAYLIVYKTKLVTKIVLPVLFGIFALVGSTAPYLIPYWNSYIFKGYNGTILNYDEMISGKAAQSDLKTLTQHLKKVHPMFKGGLTKEVQNSYLQALERIRKTESMTVNDFRREIQTVLHPMRDAHTTTYNSFPLDKYLKVVPQRTDQGYRIASVNGKTVQQIIEDAKPYFCYETEDWIDVDLSSLASLDFYGFASPFTFTWSNGQDVISEIYTETDFVDQRSYLEIYQQYFPEDETPRDHVRYETDEEKSLAVLTLTQCRYDQTYIDCVKAMFTEVKQKGIRNVAVDLRGNSGGSSRVANEFIKYLPVDKYFDGPFDWRWGFLTFHSDGKTANKRYPDLTFDGEVYVLTDNASFSSAKDFAMLIQDNHLGKVIGEPSANSVSGYGEVAYFYLPNTGLFVQISTKKWYRIDQTNTNDYVMPDFPCESADSMEQLYRVIAQ